MFALRGGSISSKLSSYFCGGEAQQVCWKVTFFGSILKHFKGNVLVSCRRVLVFTLDLKHLRQPNHVLLTVVPLVKVVVHSNLTGFFLFFSFLWLMNMYGDFWVSISKQFP